MLAELVSSLPATLADTTENLRRASDTLRDFAASITHVPEVEEAIERAIPIGASGYDPWGFSPEESKLQYSLAYWIYRYFRPVVHGIENVPAGRCLVIGNHSGQLPFDGLVVSMATLLEAEPPRLLRPMAERWFPTLPFVNIAFSRAGVAVHGFGNLECAKFQGF